MVFGGKEGILGHRGMEVDDGVSPSFGRKQV